MFIIFIRIFIIEEEFSGINYIGDILNIESLRSFVCLRLPPLLLSI